MKLNKSQIDFMKKECLRYAKLYNIIDIAINFKVEKKNDKFSNAFIDNNVRNGMATITILTDNYVLSGDNVLEDISETAKHEVIHIILSRFEELAYARFLSRENLYDELEVLVLSLIHI